MFWLKTGNEVIQVVSFNLHEEEGQELSLWVRPNGKNARPIAHGAQAVTVMNMLVYALNTNVPLVEID